MEEQSVYKDEFLTEIKQVTNGKLKSYIPISI